MESLRMPSALKENMLRPGLDFVHDDDDRVINNLENRNEVSSTLMNLQKFMVQHSIRHYEFCSAPFLCFAAKHLSVKDD